MTLAMAVITNVGIRGLPPRTICLICLTLMWMESALGVCLGCKIYGLAVRRGWRSPDPEFKMCADGACEQPARTASAVGPSIAENDYEAPALGGPDRRAMPTM